MFGNFRLPALLATALLAGCASTPPSAPRAAAGAAVAAPEDHGSAMDLGSKFKVPNRERGRRNVAVMNRQYQLETESDENGPPSAAQIFRAHAQREAVLREAQERADTPQKSAGIQPSQWEELGPGNVAARRPRSVVSMRY